MLEEQKTLKITRTGVVNDVHIVLTFEKSENKILPVQVIMSGEKYSFYSTANYDADSKAFGFHVSDFQYAETAFLVASEQISSILAEQTNTQER